MLASDSLVKYQCICCLGDVPKTSCTIRTNHSLFNCLFFLFLLVFLFSFVFLCVSVCVLSPSQSKKKQKEKNRQKKLAHPWFCPLVATDDLQSAFLRREVPEALGFSMVQNGMLWLEHSPATLLWDSSTKRLVGRRRLFTFFFLPLPFSKLFFPPTLWRRSALTPL